jgi:hypothetical protein
MSLLLLALTTHAQANPATNPWPVWSSPDDVSCDDGPAPILPNDQDLTLSDRIKIRPAFSAAQETGGPCSFTVLVNPPAGATDVLWSAAERTRDKTMGARWEGGKYHVLDTRESTVEPHRSSGRPGEWVEVGTWGVVGGELAVRLTVDGVLQYPVYVSSLPGRGCSVSIH